MQLYYTYQVRIIEPPVSVVIKRRNNQPLAFSINANLDETLRLVCVVSGGKLKIFMNILLVLKIFQFQIQL